MGDNILNKKKMHPVACLIGFIICMLMISPAVADQYVGGEELETVQSGMVSGDLWFDSFYGLSSGKSVEKTFNLPDYTEIKWARLYVAVYCGNMKTNYEVEATIAFNGGQGRRNLGTETLNKEYVFEIDGGDTPVWVNGHCNRVTSDYLMWYDVTDKITSDSVTAYVNTDDSAFDGRIKLITLVVAYDDGDSDEVYYWVNQGHDVHSYYVEENGLSYTGKTEFDTQDLPLDFNIDSATLSVVHLASENGIYTFNDESLDTEPSTGTYSGYQKWDVTDSVSSVGGKSKMTYTRNLNIEGSGGSYIGAFYKIPLAFLSVKQVEKGIYVESNPQGAEIYIDDEKQDTVTNSLITLPVGSYSVYVHKDFYYDPEPVDVDVDEGEIATVSFNLEPNSYEGKEFEVYKKGSIKGGVAVVNASRYSGLIKKGKSEKYTLDVSLPEGSTVENARLYIYSAESYDTADKEAVVPDIETTLGGSVLHTEESYRDLKVDGANKYTLETTCYDVTQEVDGSGDYQVTVRNNGEDDDVFSLYGASLVIVYSNPDSPLTSYWIAEGCDALLAADEFDTDTEISTTTVDFTGDADSVTNGNLYVVSTAASGLDDEENRIIFNDFEAYNLLNGGSSALSTAFIDVKPYLENSKNELSIQSYLSGEKGDYMENRIAVLVLEHLDTTGAEDENYGYTGKELEVYKKGSIRGGVVVANASRYTGLLDKGDSAEYSLDVSLPDSSTVEDARLYVYSTWSHDTVEKAGVKPDIETELDGRELDIEKSYRDRKGEGIYNYVLETTCYDVTDEVNGPGSYRISVTNAGGKDDAFALYGASLVVVYSDPESPVTSYWIAEGCDALLASAEFGTDTESCTTSVKFDGIVSSVTSGSLYMVSTAASGVDGDENRLFFNDYEGFNLLHAGSSDISTAILDVGQYIRNSGNMLYVQSYVSGEKGDYMENRLAVLTVGHSGDTGMTEDTGTASGDSGSVAFSPGQTSGTYPLSVSGGRAAAEHIVFGNGTIELFISEGTSLTDSTGMPVDAVTIKKSGTGNFSWAYTIGPVGVKSDLPILIKATVPEYAGEGLPELVYYDEESGKTGGTGSVYDEESGTLSSRISQLGTYAISFSSENSEQGDSDLIFPLNIIAGIFSSFLGDGGTGGEDDPDNQTANSVPSSVSLATPGATASVEPEVIEIDPTQSDFDVQICSNPASAKIFVDGEYTGRTTPSVFILRGGDHLLELELVDFNLYSEEFLLSENTTVYADLQADTKLVKERKFDGFIEVSDTGGIGGVYVTSYPDGATVYINGYNTEMKTPCVFFGLKEGMNTIKVKKESVEYSENSKKVWIDSGSVMPVNFGISPVSDNQADIDSIEYDGYYFTLNGHLPEYELPKVVDVGSANSFITFHEDGKYISHNIQAYYDSELNDIRPREYRFGKVFVDSKPDGAEIYVDGYDTGYSTPYAIDGLSDGAHYIEVSKPGYIRSGENILLTPDEAEYDAKVSIDLESYLYGSLEVTSSPSGAKIYLYNRDTGKKTPYTFRYMDIGGIDVKIVGEDSTETLEDVVINPFETTYCHVDL